MKNSSPNNKLNVQSTITRNIRLFIETILCSTKVCPNKRPEIDNLIVKVTFYDNVGNPIIGFCNVMVELKLIISFIDNKKI